MLYRIKITKCIDALVEISSDNELYKLLEEIKQLCPDNAKTYLHIIEENSMH